MKSFRFIISGEAIGYNQALSFRVKERMEKGKKIRYVDSYPSARAEKYKKHIKKAIQAYLKKWEEVNGKWDVDLTKEGVWNFKIDYILHTRALDSSNVIKLVLDATVQAGLLNDDKNVVVEKGHLVYDTENPMLIVTVYKSEQTGIWVNENHKIKWTSENCANCKKQGRCAQYTAYTKGSLKGMSVLDYICKNKIDKTN